MLVALETYLWGDNSGDRERTVVAAASVNVSISGAPGIVVAGVVAVRDYGLLMLRCHGGTVVAVMAMLGGA
jgi:hypothetical protein